MVIQEAQNKSQKTRSTGKGSTDQLTCWLSDCY